MAYVSAVMLWYYNVGVFWKPGFTGRRTLILVGLLYCAVYWFFAKMYNAHKIGLYRLVELAFSQSLTYAISDIILFVASFMWFHNFDKIRIVSWYYPVVKRSFDIICSLIALLILSPLFILVSIAVKLYDRGPVFYKQVRMTQGGREFEIYKFRGIDELPQLINILKGDMSFVGPRPERPEIANQYEENLPEFSLRLDVKAGLTGYAQVYGKYNTTPLDKLKLDLIYITNQSVTLDLKILFYTVKIIFIPESTQGVAENQDTAEKV